MNLRRLIFIALAFLSIPSLFGQENQSKGFDETIDGLLEPIAVWSDKIVFFSIGGVPIVLVLLAFTALFLTGFLSSSTSEHLGWLLKQ